MKNIFSFARSTAILSVLIICPSFGTPGAAHATDVADTNAVSGSGAKSGSGLGMTATQMLPPTTAGSTTNCGTANSILSFNPSPSTGSAINCTPVTINPSTGYFNAVSSTGSIFSQQTVGGYGVYSYASFYDAPFLSMDHAGKSHQLIGTYDGWNSQFTGHTNPMFIAGYNANTPQLGTYTDIVAIGGFGEIGTSGLYDSPVATFDLTGHKVGINNLNPQATLDVAGNENVSGTVNASAYYHNSDERLKTDIHSVSHALDKLLEIKGVEFTWKKDGRPDMGVVAQNVAAVFPNVVSHNQQGMMSVEYDSLVGPMIEAMRELKGQNDQLKAQVTEIRAEVKTLKDDNNRLRSIKAEALLAKPALSIEQ